MQLKIIKADGAVEQYLHTKVMGTINNALGRIGRADICVAEELAEVVTYYLYHRQDQHKVTSKEVLSVIKAVLTATSYGEAAAALSEHYYERRIKRSRIEVVSVDIEQLADAEMLGRAEELNGRCQWNKARIVEDLVTKYNIPLQSSRMIASMVEEKIFNMGITLVPVSLIKQLVLGDTAAVLRAQRQLQGV